MKSNFYIGGEFAAQKFYHYNEILNKFKGGTWTLSGRYALELILKELRLKGYKKIYIPIYNCPSTYRVVKKYFKIIIFYDLNKKLNPKLKKISENSVFIIVNYFGLTNRIKNSKKIYIIEDLTHSVLNKIEFRKNHTYFASFRKIGVFNFGGWSSLSFNHNLKSNIPYMEEYRKKKFNYLRKKNISNIEEKNLLKLLKREDKKLISSKACINKADIKSITNKSESEIRIIRNKNYNYLKRKLKNQYFSLPLKNSDTPLFFILKFSNIKIRNNFRNILKKNKIFCPIFWEINNKKLKSFTHSKFLSQNTLAVPIDHRMKMSDTKYVVEIIKNYDF